MLGSGIVIMYEYAIAHNPQSAMTVNGHIPFLRKSDAKRAQVFVIIHEELLPMQVIARHNSIKAHPDISSRILHKPVDAACRHAVLCINVSELSYLITIIAVYAYRRTHPQHTSTVNHHGVDSTRR